MTLTVKAIEAAKPREKGYKLTDGVGLYLYVTPTGAKSWRSNYLVQGRQKTRTYGRYPAMGLADARKAHHLARGEPEEGAAVIPTRTFREVAEKWLDKHLPSLSNGKHRHQIENTLAEWAYPHIGELPIHQIGRVKLVETVQAIVSVTGERVETAHRVAGRITAVFQHAQDSGLIEAHPASHLHRVLPARRVKNPMASVAPSRAGELMRQIDSYPDLVTRYGLQLAAYTFVRVKELRGMRWDELEEDGAVWVVPAERTKGIGGKRLPHVVPLSPQARAIIDRLREINGDRDLVLDSPAQPDHPLSENTLLFALYRLGYRGEMTVHGFRALASTVLNERTRFGADVIERQLHHKESDAVRAAYHRAEYLPQRRQLMQWWSEWLDKAAADAHRGRKGAPAKGAPEKRKASVARPG